LSEDRADGGGDHLAAGFGDLGEHVAQEVDPATLPGRAEHHLLDGLSQALVRVGDDEVHPGETAGAQRPQERGPEDLVLAVTDRDAEDLAVAVSGDTGGDHDRLGDDPGTFMGFDVGGVEEQVGELDVIQAPLAELADGDVELATDA
jgi:hypothetical protein